MRTPAFWSEGKFYLLCAVLVATAVAHAGTDNRTVALHKYETLKTRVMGDDLSVDWSEFRLAAAVAGVDGGFDWHPVRERVLAEVEAGQLDAALADAKMVIARNMAEPEGHLLAMLAYQHLGQDEAAQRERRIVDAIVHSIMTSGDGMSAQHAWQTVSSGEEDFVVDIVLDAEARRHEPVRAAGHDYDRLTVAAEDGAEHTLWFRADTAKPEAPELRVESREPSGLDRMSRR